MAVIPTGEDPELAAGVAARAITAGLATACEFVTALVVPEGLETVGGIELARLVRDAELLERRVHAVKLALIGVVERGGVARAAGLSGTAAWVAQQTGVSGAQAAQQTRTATELDLAGADPWATDAERRGQAGEWASADELSGEGGPEHATEGVLASSRSADGDEAPLGPTAAAVRAGQITAEHARVITRSLTELPEDTSLLERLGVERRLVDAAQHLDPARLCRTARRALATTEAMRAQEVLRTEEERAWERATLTIRDNLDGTSSGFFRVPTFAALTLQRVLQAMTAPRRARGRSAGGPTVAGSGLSHEGPASERATRAMTTAAAGDVTDWSVLRGQAFCELLERLPTDHLTGKVAATVVVTAPLAQLQRDLQASCSAGLVPTDAHHDLSVGELRRVACGAGLIPSVLGGASLPLDLGRLSRCFTEAQRVALATVYAECAAAGCDRPSAWSELHHEQPWHADGATDLDNAVPLCGHHHRLIHNPTASATVLTDVLGVKTVVFHRRT